MKATKKILKFEKKEYGVNNLFLNITAKIASVFSIFFSLSIVLELKEYIDTWLFIVLSIFLIFFLIVNEVVKVTNIRKLYLNHIKSLITFLITFILSMTLSGFGIYFWVNKTDEISLKNNEDKILLINDIKSKYSNEKSTLFNDKYENSNEYETLNNDLIFWKNRRGFDVDDTKNIRENIARVENELSKGRVKFEENKNKQLLLIENNIENEISIVEMQHNNNIIKISKNNFLTYILLSLVLIVEFAIIYLNIQYISIEQKFKKKIDKNIYDKYIIGRKLLESLYKSADINEEGKLITSINKAKYSIVNRMMNIEWDELNDIYNILMDMKILVNSTNIENDDNKKGVITSEIYTNTGVYSLNKLLEIYDSYFEIVL